MFTLKRKEFAKILACNVINSILLNIPVSFDEFLTCCLEVVTLRMGDGKNIHSLSCHWRCCRLAHSLAISVV